MQVGVSSDLTEFKLCIITPADILQTNLIQLWKKFFILEERMLEVDSTILTPETVFKASGW